MILSYRKHLLILLLVFVAIDLIGQKPKKLFQSDEVLEMTLTFDQKEVYKDVDERLLHDAVVGWTNPDGSSGEIPLKLKIRGHTRAMKVTCRIPPLFLNFKGSETKGTPFKKQKKIKLVTHCKDSKSYAEYVKKEYLVYRLYNIISPYSFKVRLCKITYIDSKKQDDGEVHYGFLIESIKDLAKRSEMKEYEGLLRNQEALNKDNLDKLTMYQYLIGNLDWSVPKRHNIKIMKPETNALPVAVPYDFDYSGFVNAPYAVPPEGFDISSVTDRVFRGLCRDQGYGAIIQYYKGIQNQLLEEVKNADYMEEKTRKEILDYVNSFYKLINNPKVVDSDIDKACWAKHTHRYEK